VDPASFELFRARALGEAPAAWARAKALGVGTIDGLDEPALWALHASAMQRHRAGETGGAGASLLDLKVALAEKLLAPCRLCELRCPVDRTKGETGRCGLGTGLRVYRDIVHLGEEVELLPTHTLWLAGCNWRCVYCSDWKHVDRPQDDPEVDVARVARSIEARRREGARSVTFVGGLPDVSLPGILRALQQADTSVPLVWNSNVSATVEVHELLEGLVDCHVADLKYGSERCARPASGIRGSLEGVHRNLRRVKDEAFLIVRHLVLPGHVECCARPALDWIAANLPRARVNLMGQYEPVPEVAGTAWDRRPTADELAAAREHARALGLDLDGPGPLPAPAGSIEHVPVPPATPGFESTIRIRPDGTIVFEDLPPDLAALARELAGDEADGDLDARARAAEPWMPEGGLT
jgi:putative pyruvate formate lyase activating enzyme